jgi:hypothetical protein
MRSGPRRTRAWSIQAANIARRIVKAARLVGPTPPGRVPWSLLAGGVYAAIADAGRITVELPDETEWERLDLLMGHHMTQAAARRTYAATVAAINTDRERNWINGGEE